MKNKIYLFIQTCLSLLRILRNPVPTLLPDEWHNNGETVLIGNGPSFNEFVKENLSFLLTKDIMCVNDFAISEYYEILKPNYYVMLDPAYFEKSIYDNFNKTVEQLENVLNETTHWNMFLFIPRNFYKNERFRKLKLNNRNINLQLYNMTPIDGFAWFKNLMFKMRVGAPYIQNVLVGGLHILLMLKQKNVYICGADHSWLLDIKLDHNCKLLIKDKHFYDKNVSYSLWIKDLKTHEVWKMHEILFALGKTFAGYHEILFLSKQSKTNIYNLTENSFIDAFSKVYIKDEK